jgi:CPA1 family monovalent cation:H+ antiporter
MSQTEAAMAQAQLAMLERSIPVDGDGNPVHPHLLAKYQRKASAVTEYAERPEHFSSDLHAHFNLVLAAVATGRSVLVRLHRADEIDDDILRELEHDLDLEELGAIAAKSDGFS